MESIFLYIESAVENPLERALYKFLLSLFIIIQMKWAMDEKAF